MKLNDIVAVLDDAFPFSQQESWDCSGVQLYREEVNSILVCLDITDEALKQAKANGCELIVAHHPLIFGAYYDSYPYIRAIFQECYAHNIAIMGMHTNFDNDKKGMNYQFLKLLGYDEYAFADNIITFAAVGNVISKLQSLRLPLRIYNWQAKLARGAIVLGAGGSFIEQINRLKCNFFISSEFKHHEILYAKEHGITLIDVSHQAEMIFVDVVTKYLQSKLNVKVRPFYDRYLIDNLSF